MLQQMDEVNKQRQLDNENTRQRSFQQLRTRIETFQGDFDKTSAKLAASETQRIETRAVDQNPQLETVEGCHARGQLLLFEIRKYINDTLP